VPRLDERKCCGGKPITQRSVAAEAGRDQSRLDAPPKLGATRPTLMVGTDNP